MWTKKESESCLFLSPDSICEFSVSIIEGKKRLRVFRFGVIIMTNNHQKTTNHHFRVKFHQFLMRKATRTMPAGHGGTEGKRYAQPTNSIHLLCSASQIKVIERSATWAWNMQSPFVKSEIINSNPNVREPLVKSVR